MRPFQGGELVLRGRKVRPLFGRKIDEEFGRPSLLGTHVGPHDASDDHPVEDHVIAAGGELGEAVGH